MNTNLDELINRPLVKAHFIAGFVLFFVTLIAGLLYSLQFFNWYPFPGIEYLAPARVRMVHTNGIAYGFILNTFIGGMLWVIPKLTRRSVLSDKLGWFTFWLLQVTLALTVGGLLGGKAQAIEWGETPIFVDPLIILVVVLMVVNLIVPIIKSAENPLYVSLWYFLAAFAWTGPNYIMGNYIPQFFTPGASGAAITGLFIHDLVGLLVTPIGWGMMYYFFPRILKKPIYSHTIGLIGFWGLAFFYPLNGVHHYLYSTIPMFAQYGAIVATIAVEVVVLTVFVNFFATLKGRGEALRSSMPIRWMFTGMIFYILTCAQCAFQVLLTVQQIIHFTDWVVGHAHLVMFGVFGFWILGIVTHLWPKLVGRDWYSHALLEWSYWLAAIGLLFMFVDLVAAGLIQGYMWRALSPWEDSLVASSPFWIFRTITGLGITTGMVLFMFNMWKTARPPAVGDTQKLATSQ